MGYLAQTFEVFAGSNLDQQLGFAAQSIIVDNLTSAWIYVPTFGRYIPPNTHGWQDNFPSKTQKANIQWTFPPTYQPGVINTAQKAQITLSELPVAPSQGVTVQQPSTTQQLLVKGVSAGGTITFSKVPIPPGTLMLRLLTSAGTFTSGVSVTGDQTGIALTLALPSVIASAVVDIGKLTPQLDTTMTIVATTTAATPTVWVVAILVPDNPLVRIDGQRISDGSGSLPMNLSQINTTAVDSTAATQGAIAVAPFKPATANILNGSTESNGGTIITIPANRIWYGNIAGSVLPGAAQFMALVLWTPGTGGTASYEVLLLAALSSGQGLSNNITGVCLYAGTTSGTLTWTGGGQIRGGASASGILL